MNQAPIIPRFTAKIWASSARGANKSRSVPVIQAWALEGQNLAKKGLAARLVEMGRHLVQQDQRRDAFKLLDQLGLGEDEPDEKRLLLARGALRGRRVFRPMHDN